MGMGDLTADLRLNIGAETSAKMVYENLMKFTDDVYVKESLRYLMTREVAHFQMFQAALDGIQPNFPPGILQSDPRYSNKYFNMSQGEDYKGGWNDGKSPEMREIWQHIDNPLQHVLDTDGLLNEKIEGSERTEKSVQKDNKSLSAERKSIVDEATLPKNGVMSWSVYAEEVAAQLNGKKNK
jgi:Mn-containing catalase